VSGIQSNLLSMNNTVYIKTSCNYDENLINCINDDLFDVIKPGNIVVLKPNWVKETHLRIPGDWDYVITHPSVITAVLQKVLDRLGTKGRIIIADGPQTDSSFDKILALNPVSTWHAMANAKGVELVILDLRDDEWISEDGIMVSRRKLPGDPLGSTEVNLAGGKSEFLNHKKSKRGYYGADYNIKETNSAHDGHQNLYRVSRTIMEADVFINLPKLKTHKKAGITCCLKNLVGINTYKNYLPHYTEGCPEETGDQFPERNLNSKFEGPVMAFIKQHFLHNTTLAKMFKPFKKMGRDIFGDTDETIRSGNWFGNDTVWRMIIDLNKVLLYADPDGTLREDKWINSRHYIGIVDAILAGEGNGPMSPNKVAMNTIVCGTNALAIDAVCASLMGFDPLKIPAISKSFKIDNYKLCNFNYGDIVAIIDGKTVPVNDLETLKQFEPHFGWVDHIEK
jgi:uncharacterized protein (DUF362 family)